MADRPIDPRLRFALLVPGLPQWFWRQRGRGLVYLGWYLSALIGGMLTWGLAVSPILLGFAVLVHVASAVDVLRQAMFPELGRRVSWGWALGGLGLGCYAPAFLSASVLAWPAVVSYRPLEGVLVDRSAYREADPVVGDRVWVTGQPGHGPGTAVVVAVPGQAVERLDDQYRVAGRGDWYFPRAEGRRASFELSVPEGHLLVAFEAGAGLAHETARLALVARSSVQGRVWAELPAGLLRGARLGRWDAFPLMFANRARPV
jgi:hypothetical protein